MAQAESAEWGMGEALAVVGQDWELDRAPGPAGGERHGLSI
ncbi:MAG TPA: hypothetical protein VF182_08195 [Candidatus Binatia bacterium]